MFKRQKSSGVFWGRAGHGFLRGRRDGMGFGLWPARPCGWTLSKRYGMSKESFPVFLERLKTIVGSDRYDQVVQSFSRPEVLSVRINTLKTTRQEILAKLKERNITIREVPWSAEALILEGIAREELGRMDLINDGSLYRQGLSSMLPVLALAPCPGERVLDMCAAPGSKNHPDGRDDAQ